MAGRQTVAVMRSIDQPPVSRTLNVHSDELVPLRGKYDEYSDPCACGLVYAKECGCQTMKHMMLGPFCTYFIRSLPLDDNLCSLPLDDNFLTDEGDLIIAQDL